MRFKWKINAQNSELPELFRQVGDWCDRQQLDVGQSYSIRLAVEELATNTIVHTPHTKVYLYIRIQIEKASGCVRLEYADNAPLFNPLEQADPDTKLPIKQRKIGGLGIFLLRNVMDEVSYAYTEGENRLTMIKKDQKKDL